MNLCVLRGPALCKCGHKAHDESRRIQRLLQTEDEVMHRIAFKMKLFKGKEEEYKKRHDAIWPELKSLLKTIGVEDYSIFLDQETNLLFGVLKVGDATNLDELPHHPVMKKWWSYMRDIMETGEDNSPISIRLKEVFYLP